jgi:NhaA family Na+:H+ antiporter
MVTGADLRRVGIAARTDRSCPGWAIPCATDIAFSAMIARLIFPSTHPAIPFLLLLAIADDALGLVILAVFYPSGTLSLAAPLILMPAAIALALWLRRRHARFLGDA